MPDTLPKIFRVTPGTQVPGLPATQSYDQFGYAQGSGFFRFENPQQVQARIGNVDLAKTPILTQPELQKFTDSGFSSFAPGIINVSELAKGTNVSSPIFPPETAPSTKAATSVQDMLGSLQIATQKAAEEAKNRIQELQKMQTENLSIFQKTLGTQPSIEDIQKKVFTEQGITPETFAKQNILAAEIGQLNTELAKLESQKNEALGRAGEQPIPMELILGPQAVIERQYHERINAKAAQAGAKAMELELLRGNVSQARAIASDVVQAATADKKFAFDQFQFFYNANQEFISDLRQDERLFVQQRFDLISQSLNIEQARVKQLTDLMIQNSEAGISITDTIEEATSKIAPFAARERVLSEERLGASSTTNDFKEYMIGTAQGFKGTFLDWQRTIANLKAPRINISQSLDKLLSVEEANKLGVPFGTKASEVVGVVPLTSNQRQLLSTKESAITALNEVRTISQKVNTFEPGIGGINRLFQGAKNYYGAITQTNPDAAQLKAQAGILAQIVRGLGEVGTLATKDVERVQALIPGLSTTKEIASRNLTEIETILKSAKEGVIAGATTQVRPSPPQSPELADYLNSLGL